MDFSIVLNHLQSQFPGQMVLYVEDIAKILGKSEKALQHLISRDALPFNVKMLGGKRCLDIFHVAQWLASEPGQTQETAATPAPSQRQQKSVRKNAPQPAAPALAPGKKAGPTVLTGLMAQQILQMSKEYQRPLGRFVQGLPEGSAEQEFMLEVIEKLFFDASMLQGGFILRMHRAAAIDDGAPSVDRTWFFLELEDARIELLTYLEDASNRKSNDLFHYTLHHGDDLLFHLTVVSGEWHVRVNKVPHMFSFE